MSLLLTDDQELLRKELTEIADAQYSPTKVRAFVDRKDGAPFDTAAWSRLAGEFNLPGICIPEEFGGAGGDHRTRAVILTELGARVAPTPYFGTAVLFTDALLLLDDDAARTALLPKVAAGELLGAFAVAETDTAWALSGLATTAAADGDTWTVTGTKTMVIDGSAADQLIVTATANGETAFFLVDAKGAGVTRTALPSTDLTRNLAEIQFDGATATRLSCADPAAVLARLADQAAVALSAEILGGLRRSVEVSVDYAKVRYQFGRPIGSFQALKHRMADMYVRVELATAAVRNAALAADGEGDDLTVAASLTLARLSDFYRRTGDDLIHVHGGIGYTWEHEAHLYFRRAISCGSLLGSRDFQLNRLADALGI